ncbi:MAG: HlyD family secretion protein [Candidatus Saganbacteria bacterium]|nr:HlyD family secretion protein [Candidatus Saganbacteria bacterium]
MTDQTEKHHQIPWWKRSRIRWFAVALIVVILLGFVYWWGFFRAYVSTNDARIATNILQVAPVGVGGKIEKVMAEDGSFVKAGQVLVEIDHRVPEAQYNKTKAKYKLMRIDLDRVKNLVDKKISPKSEYDTAKTNLEVAEADMRLAEVNLQNTYLKSPIDGVVIKKIAEAGNILEPGQVAIIISDVDHAWVSANIEETSIGSVKVGQPVYIKIDEGGALTGKVLEITAATASQFSLLPSENSSGNFTKLVQKMPIKIALDPHPNRVLKVGQSVTVRIKVR